MSPRLYRLDQRQAAIERCKLLAYAFSDGYARFSIETVAHQADVIRMMVRVFGADQCRKRAFLVFAQLE